MFLAHGAEVSSRKRWIGFTARACGALQLDAGAVRAVVKKGKSLLPAGVTDVRGVFARETSCR